MNKGLVVIYDPHALMQFLQFYCMEKSDIEWDALCLPKENGEEEMHRYCESTGLFNKIFSGNVEYMSIQLIDKLKMFIKMFIFYVFGRRRLFCEKEINKYVDDIMQYDVLVGNTESGLITGMLSSFAKEKRVVYFEDGTADYSIKRKKWKTIFKWNTLINLEGVILSRLGYCCKGYCYFEPTKYCEKYATNKKLLSYTNYKRITDFEFRQDENLFLQQLVEKTWSELKNIDIIKDSAILFTDPLIEDYHNQTDINDFIKKCFMKITDEHENIIIKRHPRDNLDYGAILNDNYKEINRDIPAEMLFPFIQGCDCYFFGPCSVILGMRSYGISPTVFWNNSQFERPNHVIEWDRDKLNHFLDAFSGGEAKIIDIY